MSKRNGSGPRRNAILGLFALALACVAVWFLLIDGPRARLKKRQQARSEVQAELDASRKQMNSAIRAKEVFAANQQRLENIEAKIPVGDPYRWIVKAFAEFAGASRVAIANIEAPHVSESTIYPKVPYRVATFGISGTGFYEEFGVFLAELENEFPHMRVRRLELSPAYPGTADSDEVEKLNFQMELMVLFKPAAATPTQLSQATGSPNNN
jgi:hypothetical protein